MVANIAPVHQDLIGKFGMVVNSSENKDTSMDQSITIKVEIINLTLIFFFLKDSRALGLSPLAMCNFVCL